MIEFTAAPAIPSDYGYLNVLSKKEIEKARAAGYVADSVDPRDPVQRAGLNNYLEARAYDDMRDWRTRIFVIWFCYIFENFRVIKRPMGAIEELILEFKSQIVIDTSHGP